MMKLENIVKFFKCTVYTEANYDANRSIDYAFCADLMSDALMIMSTVKSPELLKQSVLITGLATNQSLRTAEMLDVEVVLLVRGKVPAQQVIALAEESNIILLGTDATMFNTSGMMYQSGVRGITYNQQ
jgi:hypothetical protein